MDTPLRRQSDSPLDYLLLPRSITAEGTAGRPAPAEGSGSAISRPAQPPTRGQSDRERDQVAVMIGVGAPEGSTSPLPATSPKPVDSPAPPP